MSVEQNKELTRRFMEEAFTRRNMGAIDRFFADDYTDHSPWPGTPASVEGFKQGLSAMLTAFPDMDVKLERVIAEGDLVVTHTVIHGTHRGEFMGAPPTGKKIAVEGIDIMRVQNGKLVEHWGETDTMGLLQQLGMAPNR